MDISVTWLLLYEVSMLTDRFPDVTKCNGKLCCVFAYLVQNILSK
jgi:hypothetical protein